MRRLADSHAFSQAVAKEFSLQTKHLCGLKMILYPVVSFSLLAASFLLRSWNPLEAFGLVSPPEEWFRDTHPVRGLLDSISFDRWSEGVGVLAYLIMLWMQLSQQNCFRVLHATLSLDIGKTTNQSNFVQMPPELICRSVIWTCASAAFFKRS